MNTLTTLLERGTVLLVLTKRSLRIIPEQFDIKKRLREEAIGGFIWIRYVCGTYKVVLLEIICARRNMYSLCD